MLVNTHTRAHPFSVHKAHSSSHSGDTPGPVQLVHPAHSQQSLGDTQSCISSLDGALGPAAYKPKDKSSALTTPSAK